MIRSFLRPTVRRCFTTTATTATTATTEPPHHPHQRPHNPAADIAHMQRYIRLRKSRKFRMQTKRAVLAGSKLIDELFERTLNNHPPAIRHIYLDATVPEWVQHRWQKKAEHASVDFDIKVTNTIHPALSRGNDFSTMTGMTHNNEGIAAEIDLPLQLNAVDAAFLVKESNSRVLVLDGLQDPGNVGTLIRTAYLLGWDLVCLGTGSVDASNDKVLRASGGTVFDMPIYGGPINALLKQIMMNNHSKAKPNHSVQCLLADMGNDVDGKGGGSEGNDDSLAMCSQNLLLDTDATVVLVLGNEGNGVTRSNVSNTATKTGTITVKTRDSKVGSLGVASAGSILMHALRYR